MIYFLIILNLFLTYKLIKAWLLIAELAKSHNLANELLRRYSNQLNKINEQLNKENVWKQNN